MRETLQPGLQHLIQQYGTQLSIGVIATLVAAACIRRWRRGNPARPGFHTMGYQEVPRDQVFANPIHVGASFQTLDDACQIPASVARGPSALGETLAFEVSCKGGAGPPVTRCTTVVGFHVDRALPDFRISHLEAIGLGHQPPPTVDAAAAGRSGAGVQLAEPSFQITESGYVNLEHPPRHENRESARALLHATEHLIAIDDPAFSMRHHVYGSDDAAVRAMLTPGFTAALANEASSDNLVAHKTGEWLFVYADRGQRRVHPEDLPRRVSRAAALVQQMNLRPATPVPPATTPAGAAPVDAHQATLARGTPGD